jgi:hypothetical protein
MKYTAVEIFTLRVLGGLAANYLGPDAKKWFDALANAAQSGLNIDRYMQPVADAMAAGTPPDWKSAHEELAAASAHLQGGGR